jgi:hypothetical protein
MTMRIVLPFFLVAGLALASARTYSVSLTKPTMIGATELKVGDVRIELDGDKAVLRQGKVQTESAVKVEEAETKFSNTVVRYANAPDGKQHIQEIRLGGTRTRIVFAAADTAAGSR